MPAWRDWRSNSGLVAIERSATGSVVGLTHLSYPLIVITGGSGYGQAVQQAGAVYLRMVGALFGLPANLMYARSAQFRLRPSGLQLTWLPFDGDPRNSVFVDRFHFPHPPGQLLDRTATLFAVPSWAANNASTALRSRMGIRISVRADQRAGLRWEVAITSAMVSEDLAPALALAPMTQGPRIFSPRAIFPFLNTAKSLVANALGVQPGTVHLDGFRPYPLTLKAGQHDFYANISRAATTANAPAQGATLYGVNIRLKPRSKWSLHIQSLESHALSANATAPVAQLFTHGPGSAYAVLPPVLVDPASQPAPRTIEDASPNRSPDDLGVFLHPILMTGLGSGNVPLADPAGWFEVRQSKLANPAANENLVESLDPALLRHARTNAYAAASAYQQTAELFKRIDDFGLLRSDIFKFASKPLVVRYRAPIFPGPGKDGKTVNAQVDFDPPQCDFSQPLNGLQHMEMCFALADLKRSSSSREPLGLATDPRWSWHEFCHVLLAGSTGKLELAFVHSAGDALAAIACDPRSELADDRLHPGMRGATFPWVFVDRRHDRSARLGWSWSGTYHRPGRFALANSNCRHKGYDSEQILSTCLFRVYLAVGGDTVRPNGKPDLPVRQAASDYVVYLIVRAILSLGSAVPLETAEQFVTLLMDVDGETEPATTGPLAGRVGGCAHKVLRWAFEVQGMYANVAAQTIHDAPGNPPDVDLFIDDGRQNAEGQFPRGGYMPTSLDWNSAGGARPAWQATGNDQTQLGAMVVSGRRVTVTVQNRSGNQATNVKVVVSFIRWTGPNIPPWNSNSWTSRVANGPTTIAAHGSAQYMRHLLPVAVGRYLILAHVNCDEDLANTNPKSKLPCAKGAVALVDLVAGDNNLGLRDYQKV